MDQRSRLQRTIDSSGNAYVTGETLSTNFPTKNPLQANISGSSDMFITKLSPNGQSLIYSTYLGGSGRDFGAGIALDTSNSAYVTGQTTSTDFPTKNPFQPNSGGGNFEGFVTKLSADGQSLVYSTYFGGNDGDSGVGIAVDSSSNAYVSGYTFAKNFPTKNPLQASYGGGFEDSFIAKISDASVAPASTFQFAQASYNTPEGVTFVTITVTRKLNQFNGNFVQAEIVRSFLLSTEYRQRFGP